MGAGGTHDRANHVRVALFTSVSPGNADYAAATMPNKLEYCLRHGYSLIASNQPYDEAVGDVAQLCDFLDRFDLVWTLDSDAVITNLSTAIHNAEFLGPNVTVCREEIVDWNLLNCGSIVWKNTFLSRWLAATITATKADWEQMPCIWQTWLAHNAEALGHTLAIAPARAFNSCVWNRPGNARDEIGGHWQPGDFVYHPCGVYPPAERTRWIQHALTQVVR